MGDLSTLLEKAEQAFDEDEAIALSKKLMEDKFTLQDFLDQLQRVKRMGPIMQVMNMIPGFSKLQAQQPINQDEVEGRLKKVEAIINSMTPAERKNPKILNASRKKRNRARERR